jgi:hypothetical protein
MTDWVWSYIPWSNVRNVDELHRKAWNDRLDLVRRILDKEFGKEDSNNLPDPCDVVTYAGIVGIEDELEGAEGPIRSLVEIYMTFIEIATGGATGEMTMSVAEARALATKELTALRIAPGTPRGRLIGEIQKRIDDFAPKGGFGAFRNADEAIDFLRTKCFARDTVVSTENGLRPIGEISIGEQVHSFDFEAGEWKLRTVTDRIDSVYEGPVVTIEARSSKIEATIHHPFWVVEGHELTDRSTPRKLSDSEDQGEALTGRWVNSHELLAGDVIIGRQGERLIVERVSQRFEKSFPVSNLTIGEFHNYSVGANSILVHNETVCDAGRAALQDMLDSGAASYDEIARLIRGFDNADDVLANIARNSTTFHLHHSWPKYLGGPAKQDLVRLPKHIHDAFHNGLDKILDRRLGSAYYDGLTGAARTRLEQQLASFTKQFDARYGTSLWEAMLRNGFPGG